MQSHILITLLGEKNAPLNPKSNDCRSVTKLPLMALGNSRARRIFIIQSFVARSWHLRFHTSRIVSGLFCCEAATHSAYAQPGKRTET
jgi:hypothetical protein